MQLIKIKMNTKMISQEPVQLIKIKMNTKIISGAGAIDPTDPAAAAASELKPNLEICFFLFQSNILSQKQRFLLIVFESNIFLPRKRVFFLFRMGVSF